MLADVASQRCVGKGGKLGLESACQSRRLKKLPSRPEIVEEMRDRRANKRICKAHEDGRQDPWLHEMQRTGPSLKRRGRDPEVAPRKAVGYGDRQALEPD